MEQVASDKIAGKSPDQIAADKKDQETALATKADNIKADQKESAEKQSNLKASEHAQPTAKPAETETAPPAYGDHKNDLRLDETKPQIDNQPAAKTSAADKLQMFGDLAGMGTQLYQLKNTTGSSSTANGTGATGGAQGGINPNQAAIANQQQEQKAMMNIMSQSSLSTGGIS